MTAIGTDSTKVDPSAHLLGVRVGGIVILIGSLLMVFAMLHHPTGHAHDFGDFVDKVDSIRTVNALVHGSAIAVMIMFVFGFSWLSTCIGWNRPAVRMAMIVYTLGAVGMIVAAMVSGFIVPFFLERYAQAPFSEAEIAKAVLDMLRNVNRAFDQLGVCAMSIGVVCWSISILNHPRRDWLTGVLGLLVGGGGLVGMFTGHLAATVQGIISFVLLQALWNIAVSIQMIRRRW